MISDRDIWIGDKVQVPTGIGVVLEVVTWRSKVEGMRESEARAFCDQCSREVGVDYRKKWGEVLVKVGEAVKWHAIATVKVIEGRDGKTDSSGA